MWVCNDCGQEFEEPKTIYEWHSELNGMGGNKCEKLYVCPVCESDDIEEEDLCDFCGRPAKLINAGTKYICESCLDEIAEKLTGIRDEMHNAHKWAYGECEHILMDIAEVIWK